MVGIDGGGTKTEAALCREDGVIVALRRAGPSNYQTVGAERARTELEALLNALLDDAGVGAAEIELVYAGMAGVNGDEDRSRVSRIISEVMPGVHNVVENDAVVALYGATRAGPGVAVIGGTGSVAFGMNRYGERARTGGWGHIMDDAGSAYHIALMTLRSVVRACDGRGPLTDLVDVTLRHFEIDHVNELYDKLYVEGCERHRLAELARVTVEAAEGGDEVAVEICETAARELALLATTLLKRLRMDREEVRVACVGGVFSSENRILTPFTRRVLEVAPLANVGYPEFPPVAGALFGAFIALGRSAWRVKVDFFKRRSSGRS